MNKVDLIGRLKVRQATTMATRDITSIFTLYKIRLRITEVVISHYRGRNFQSINSERSCRVGEI